MELRPLSLISLYSRRETMVEYPEGREAAVECRVSSESLPIKDVMISSKEEISRAKRQKMSR